MAELNFINDDADPDMINKSLHHLHLNPFSSACHNLNRPPCSACGCFLSSCPTHSPPQPPCTELRLNPNPMKRRSPDANPSPAITATKDDAQEPRSKKLFVDNQQTPCVQENSNLFGFSKISLPSSSSCIPTQFQSSRNPVLRRCASDPYNPPASPPENVKIVSGGGPGSNFSSPSSNSGSLPPLPPPPPPSLRRCASEINTSPVKSIFSRSSSSNELDVDHNPSTKRLDRMKEKYREMCLYYNDQIRQEEEELAAAEENHQEDYTEKVDFETECEEAISVERRGDCLIIHFKCPCGKGYQILLSGRSCYYKLL